MLDCIAHVMRIDTRGSWTSIQRPYTIIVIIKIVVGERTTRVVPYRYNATLVRSQPPYALPAGRQRGEPGRAWGRMRKQCIPGEGPKTPYPDDY